MTDRIDGPAAEAGNEQPRLDPKIAAIRDLNDRLRRNLQGGLIVVTPGVEGLGATSVRRAFIRLRAFDSFTPDNDPYGEHDFGSFDIDGARFFWKIDYYDPTLTMGSSDPADPKVTRRVLTLMLSDEY